MSNDEQLQLQKRMEKKEKEVAESLLIWESYTTEEQEHVLMVTRTALQYLRDNVTTWVRWALSKEGPHVRVSPEILLTDIIEELTALAEEDE